MKCDTCWWHCVEHATPSQPYTDQYCAKGHWGGTGGEPEPEVDPWANCSDFELDTLLVGNSE